MFTFTGIVTLFADPNSCSVGIVSEIVIWPSFCRSTQPMSCWQPGALVALSNTTIQGPPDNASGP